MMALLSIAALTGAGLALLDLLRLRVRSLAVDLPVAWLLGQGWFGLGAMALRFLLGVPFGRVTALGLVLLPPAALAVRAWRARSRPASAGEVGPVAGASTPATAPRWRPRPAWLYGPLLGLVVLVALAVILHSLNSPTNTDDGVRVRAYAPVLAFVDAWSPEARQVLLMAGPLPTWVPAFGWALTGQVEHVHTNAMVLADLLALLLLAVGLGAARGRPERGIAGAFLVCSLPLVVYHLTTTYSDAPLALHVAAGFLFALEYARGQDRDDAVRAMLLFATGALIKREGLVVAGAAAAVLLLSVVLDARRAGRSFPWRVLAAAAPVALLVLASAAALGLASAVPLAGLFASRATDAATRAVLAPPEAVEQAPALFGRAVFLAWNHGLIFWMLPVALLARASTVRRRHLAWPLGAVALLFLESAVSSIWLAPQFTLNGTTVHRSLIPAAVAGALFLAALLTEPEEAPPPRRAPASPSPRRRGGRP
jgi:hypothetical protein